MRWMMHGYQGFDEVSFHLGAIDCFCEMVSCGLKKLALSHPLEPAEYQVVKRASDEIALKHGVKSLMVEALVDTDLSPEGGLAGKRVILYYIDDHVLEEYRALEKEVGDLREAGRYSREARSKATLRLCRLLSYPEKAIRKKFALS
jgi:hypothetical protein